MKKKKWILSLIYFLIFINTFYFIYNIKNPKADTIFASNRDMLYSSYDERNLGIIESIIEYGDHSVIAVHYPVFGKENIDYMIKDLILTQISSFKLSVKNKSTFDINYKSELNIDYESYLGPNDIISIKFIILENSPYFASPKVEIDTLVVDLKKDKQVLLRNILKGKYLEKISSLAKGYFKELEGYKDYVDTVEFQQGIAPNFDNYSHFLLENDRIIIIFQKYQLFPGHFGYQAIEIPFTLIEDFLKTDLVNMDALETYVPLNTIESENKDSLIEVKETPEDPPLKEEPPLEKNSVVSRRKIDPNKPMIALTFDDGPYFRATVPILNTLKKHDCVATFFVLGNRVPNHKNVIKRMADEGSEIGNHSYNHKQLTTLNSKELKDQINRTQKAVLEVVGSEPKVLRPTYGSYDNKLRSAIDMPIILWSIDPQDWKVKDAKKIKEHILARVRDGDIILMHDIFEATADAVEMLIPELLDRGFQLVTVSELYELKGKSLQVGNVYSHLRQR